MENFEERVKLPSSWTVINPESIWRFLQTIAKTGSTFNKEQLIKAGLYTTSDDNIGRNLSYLKYLVIIEEERGKGKDQRFKIIEKSAVKDIFYELKANREDEAKRKLKVHLQHHVLFQTLKDEFFKADKNKTLTDLEHFLKDGIPNKNPQYYQKGGEFLIKLLGLASLAHIDGNDIKLDSEFDDELVAEPLTPELNGISEGKMPLTIPKQGYEEAIVLTPDKYVVQFIGPGLNTKLEIQDEDDFLILDATISKIKKKIIANEAN